MNHLETSETLSVRSQKKRDRIRGLDQVRVRIQSRSDREPTEAMRRMWGDHWVKQELSREMTRLGASMVEGEADVVIHLFGGPPKKKPTEKTYNIVWLYSHPDLADPAELETFDRIYCASPVFLNKIKFMGLPKATLMPACTSKSPVSPPLTHTLIFLGNARASRPDGRAVVRDIQETGFEFKVWGNLWDSLLPPSNIGGLYWPYESIEYLYASARITLNDHHPDMAREGFVSNKVFDILASGGFVISDDNPGVTKIFGEAVPCYRNAAHLRELAAHFLTHDRERQERAALGREIAMSHTYRDRARTFLSEIRP